MSMFTNCTVDCNSGNVQMIEYLYISIVSCLVDSACNSVPKTRCNFFKFRQDENLKNLKCTSIDAHALWKANGCPTSGDIYNLQRCAKANYKRALRQKVKDESLSFCNDLNDYLLQKDQTSFWKTWKAKYTSKTKFSDFFDGSNNASVIFDTFACMFQSASSNNSG